MAELYDPKGNDLSAIQIPLDGQIWLGPSTIPVLAKTELLKPVITIPPALVPLGLLTTDGGPEWSVDGQGQSTEFWQQGYQLPGDGGWYTLAATAAQGQRFVDELLSGDAFAADGYRDVTSTSNAKVYTCLAVVAYKGGQIQRRMSNNVMVQEGARQKSERGKPTGTNLKLKWLPMANGVYFAEAVVAAA